MQIRDLRCEITPDHFPTLTRIEKFGKRFYSDGKKVYPSVTTVLGYGKDETFLKEWRARIGEDKANAISKNSTTRGTALHKLLEDHIFTDTIQPPAGTRWDVAGMYRSMRREINKSLTAVYGTELQMYSERMLLSGTADLVGVWDGEVSLIDYKNSSKPKEAKYIEDYFLQATAYSLMFEERTKILCDNLVIVIGVEGYGCQVFKEKRTKARIKELSIIRERFYNEVEMKD